MKYVYTMFLIFNSVVMSTLHAVETPGLGQHVYDLTSEKNALIQIQNMKEALDYNRRMVEQIGRGDLNPATIDYIGNIYKTCGGKKYGLPDWFPKPNLKICADEQNLLEISVSFYRDNIISLSDDGVSTIKNKQEKMAEEGKKVQAMALARSVIDMEKSKQNSDVIEKLQTDQSTATDQIAITKLQLQVQIMMLEQLHTLNERQALLIHMAGYKQ